MQIEEPRKNNVNAWAPFGLGFRPFFLLAGISAVVLMWIWLGELSAPAEFKAYYSGSYWHAHEMLFGYTVAVVSGFLLTAVRNWTDLPMPSGRPLLGLVLLWLIARLLPYVSGVIPAWLIAVVDLSLLPLVAWSMALRIVKRRQYRNLIFVVVVFFMFIANLLVHLEVMGFSQNTAGKGLYLMMFLVMLIITVMGGRVIPFFAERGVQGITTKSWQLIEIMSVVSVLLLLTAVLFFNDTLAMSAALLAFVVHLIRLAGWYDNKIWQEPLVWILLVAYAWIVLGFGLIALAYMGKMPLLPAWHAYTVGGLGGLTLGMMARVALGHTGRAMKLPKWMASAFVLINVAAVFRVILPLLLPQHYQELVNIAGVLWIVAFLIFVVIYTPILLKARVDGRPG